MPNHFQTVGLCAQDYRALDERGLEEMDFSPLEKANLCHLVLPLPPEQEVNWYRWCIDNWGTKRGTYDTKVLELEGDGTPVMIQFCSAWSPPTADMMALITKFLEKEFCLKNIVWLGHDPFDNSTGILHSGEKV